MSTLATNGASADGLAGNSKISLFSDDEDSPYRGGNYDLLKTLLTREAVRAALDDDALADGDRAFLRDFANERPLGSGSVSSAATCAWSGRSQ